jgi:hypothetical protein
MDRHRRRRSGPQDASAPLHPAKKTLAQQPMCVKDNSTAQSRGDRNLLIICPPLILIRQDLVGARDFDPLLQASKPHEPEAEIDASREDPPHLTHPLRNSKE